MSMRIRCVLAGAAAVLSAAAFSPQAQAEDKIKMGFSSIDVSNLLPYVAQDEGFFKKNGLEVEFVNFQIDSAAAQGITAGAVDVNTASIWPVIDAWIAGRDLVSFWNLSNMPGYVWMGPKKYTTLKDVKGGKVGVSSIGSMAYYFSNWAVGEAGLNPKTDVQYLAVGGPLQRVAALKAGQVDAIPATPPGSYLLEEEGYKPLFETKEKMPEASYEVFYTRKAYIERDADKLKRLIVASIQAKHWAMEHKDETTAILMKYLGAPDNQKAAYRKTVDFALPYSPDDGHFNQSSMNTYLGFYKDQGKIKDIPPLSDFVDFRFINEFTKNPIK